ncbi:MAG: chemotaxis protein CheA, partial [Gammaproteobacteria bacterium]|nr:chemotaxis protein CheA [Gammaproteobacteria bacterium]
IVSIFPQLKLQTESQAEQQTTDVVESEQTDEEKLYQKLSNALDTDASKSEGAEYELLHGVFEEMISEREDAPVEKRPVEKQPVKKPSTKKQPVAKTASSKSKAASPKAASPEVQPASTKKKVIKKSATETTAKAVKKSQSEDTGKTGSQTKANQRGGASKPGDTALKKNIRVEAEKIDSLINQVGELVVDRAYFFQLFDDMRGLQQHFKDEIGLDQKEMKQVRAFTYRMGEAIASLSRTSNDLQEGVMKIRMLPISQLFNRYPRLVHDLTRNNSKKVNLKVEGEDTELDKMVVEKLSDPLIHIIRNAVDHGLEDGKDRIAAGKPEVGTLFLKSYHESNQVVVEIMDDGRGINPELVKKKAIEKGVVSKNEAERMTPQELIRLITTAGFSTADEITDTSGRGVGMDVVRKNIEKLNGTLEIDSRIGQGTSVRLKIPLTLAIIPAHLVRVSGNMYTIPLANIEETLRIRKGETTVIEGTEVIYLREKTLPIIHLSNLFNTHDPDEDRENFFVVVVNTGTQKIGLVVDELLGQEEVVIKPLEDYLRDQSGFSGATIIGDGSISLILDIYEIANMMANEQIRRQQQRTMQRKSAGAAGHAG